MSFYRIYRPQIIEEIDNAAIREELFTFLHKERKDLPHAYLFSGSKGTGKTTAARLVAKIFNCEKLSKREGPCGKCEQCTSIAKGNNLDVLEIDAASNRGIDEIRSLREQIHLAPVSGEYKIYIIDEVHMLTMEAFNALLKTLEEPPEHTIFVLATTDVHKVPATIQSRCIHLTFSQATTQELTSAIHRIVKKEKIDIDREALTTIAEHAGGSFRDAAKILEQMSFKRGKISSDVIRKTLSLSEEKLLEQFLEQLTTRNAKEALQTIGILIEKGHDIKTFLVDVLQKLEHTLVARTLGSPSNGWERDMLQEAIRRLSQAYAEMKSSPIAQLPIELAIVEFCQDRFTQIKEERIRTDEGIRKNPLSHPQQSSNQYQQKQSTKGESLVGLLTLEKLNDHWADFIADLKTYNHSVSGVLRSSRPKAVEHGIVTIEAFYPFHQEKLSEPKTKLVLADTFRKLFGEKVKVEIVLGKK